MTLKEKLSKPNISEKLHPQVYELGFLKS